VRNVLELKETRMKEKEYHSGPISDKKKKKASSDEKNETTNPERVCALSQKGREVVKTEGTKSTSIKKKPREEKGKKILQTS